MPVSSAPEVLVLLALRLTGLAEPADVAARTGVDEAAVRSMLDGAAADGRVRYREGTFHGWALTPTGRRDVEARLAAELDGAGLRSALDDTYGRFRDLNGTLLALCTAWQLRDVGGQPMVNEHDDPGYDAGCIEQLVELNGKAEPVVDDLGHALERFGPYPGRLRTALDRVQAGDVEWFTSPGVDSYHTVWFELHENLLATLGLERARETAAVGRPANEEGSR